MRMWCAPRARLFAFERVHLLLYSCVCIARGCTKRCSFISKHASFGRQSRNADLNSIIFLNVCPTTDDNGEAHHARPTPSKPILFFGSKFVHAAFHRRRRVNPRPDPRHNKRRTSPREQVTVFLLPPRPRQTYRWW